MQSAGAVVVLAAGEGKRMRAGAAKVLHPLCGRPMIGYVLDQARALSPERIVVVVGAGAEEVERHVREREDARGVSFAVQERRLGTGDAVRAALPELEGAPGPLVVLYGDMPLLRPETLARLVAAREAEGVAAALLVARPERPRGFGRIVRDAEGGLARIVEERDATPEELLLREVNVGVSAFELEDVRRLVPGLSRANAQGEAYLTDAIGALVAEGRRVATVEVTDERETIGVNTLAHLAEARAAVQERILEAHLEAGVSIEDPRTTYVDWGVEIGEGTRVLPCTVIRAGVRIGRGCEVGPFTHLREGTELADGAEIGNFTEAKKAVVGAGTKAKHLTYLGDVRIGARANIGAGTIVANYDGKEKHLTVIGDEAFVGSGTVLIAPVRVGDRALTGGGAVVTRNSDIPDGDAWVGVPARPLAERGRGRSAPEPRADEPPEGEQEQERS